MKKMLLLLLLLGCSKPEIESAPIQFTEPDHISIAYALLGYSENTHNRDLKLLLGFNPSYTEWCAAFINKVLEASGQESVDSLGHKYPLLARSYLSYGEMILEDELIVGDILIFKRGNVSWKGHVGFYIGTEYIRGKKYYRVLGGNQSNEVNISLYSERKLLGIRRPINSNINILDL